MLAIAPSILAADFSRLGELVREVEAGGADRIHVDVMDGHFVPNLSMGPVVVKGLRPVTKLPLEVHLMVADPAKFAEPFIVAGADSLIVHQEVLLYAERLIRETRARGKRIGMAINPGTPVEAIEQYLPDLDLALCMTVWPGFGGQAFIQESLARITALCVRSLKGATRSASWKWMAASICTRHPRVPKPAPMCSWPAHRSSAPPRDRARRQPNWRAEVRKHSDGASIGVLSTSARQYNF